MRVDVESGEASVEPASHGTALEPMTALVRARDYAVEHGMSWKPSFNLECTPTHWIVGACQAQLGGQVYIHVGHDGEVQHSFVNPK